MKRALEEKQKTFFLVSKAFSFKNTKETSKNVAETTFKHHKEIIIWQKINNF